MNTSKWQARRVRHPFLTGSATSAAAVALIVIGLPAAALATRATSHASPAHIGPGYPPPGGIYTPFTDCPLLNPIMQESASGDATGCVDGAVASGSITIGNIVTPVVRPVDVQFGIWDPPNATFGGDNTGGTDQFAGGILPPPAGVPAMVSTKPDLIPESLTTALGCPSTARAVQNICTEAVNFGGKYNEVFALAQSAGQLTNFGLFNWTQRLMFKLINPLLSNNCFIGSVNNPIVVNPQLAIGPGGQLNEFPDPNPTKHPNTDVLQITDAVATDTVFSAPGVTGCGPGGAANIAIDSALDAGTGLPAASGVNSLTLNGTFSLAISFNTANQDKILISAFKESVHTPATARRLSITSLRSLIGHYGLR
ncbi:MAG TPA: hypothetical protein VGL63_12070 [Streptosporangiaceae bacterium]